ncbi:MAG: hypothetical protein RR416_01715, partial [Clostridia bacterium]
MRKNTKNRISIVTIAVAILLIVVLSTAIAATFGNGVGNHTNMPNAAGEVPIHVTDNNSIDGTVATRKTQSDATNEGAQWITTTQQLVTFLNGATANQKAYLGGDVAVDYANDKMGQNVRSSDIPFYGTIDGNGYTVNINSVGGGINYVKKPNEWVLYSDFGPEPKDRQGNEYHASGLFVGVNYGTIKNVNFNYTSNHMYAWTGESSGPNWDSMLVSGPHPQYTTAFGIVCGINYAGKINNCSLKVNNPLVVFHQENVWDDFGANIVGSNKKAYMFSNSAMVGGFSGVTGREGSEITRCTLDMSEDETAQGGSINGLVRGNTYGSNTKKHSLSIAGGISANFYPGEGAAKSATISYCTIKGVGAIRACSSYGSYAGNNHAYAGGAVGPAGYISDYITFTRFDMTKTNIHHIMSSWQGILNNTDGIGGAGSVATPYTSYARLFGAIGNAGMTAGTINGIVLLFDMPAFLTNKTIESPEYIDDGKVDHRVKASDSAILVYRTNDGGAMKARFDYSSPNMAKDLRIETLAGTKDSKNDYTFKNFQYNDGTGDHTGSMDMVLPEAFAGTGSLKFKMGTPGSMEESQTGNFIWDATFMVGSSSSGHIKTEDMCGAEILLANASVAARYAYTFGEITDYEFDPTSNTSSPGMTNGKEYDGLPLKEPKIILKSAAGSADLVGETGGCQYNITKSGVGTTLENTVAPGIYKFEPEQILGEEKVVYHNVNQRVLARKKINPTDNKVYTFGVGAATLDIQITERKNNPNPALWLKQATFELSIMQNGVPVAGLFDYIKVLRDGVYTDLIPTKAIATYLYKETKNTT